MTLQSTRPIAVLAFFLHSFLAFSQNPDCLKNTFFKTLGAENVTEFGSVITRSGDGNLYIAGRNGTRTFVQKTNYAGEAIWLREFQINPFEPITPIQIIEDSEGMIVGCGTQIQFAGATRGFVFRYNPVADALLWAHPVASNNPTAAGIVEKTAGGSFVYYQNPVLGGGETDIEILDLDRATGAIIPAFASRYEHISFDALAKIVSVDGSLYGLGSAAGTHGSTTEARRALLARFDPVNGSTIWAQLNPVDTSVQNQFIGRDLAVDGDALVAAYVGDYDSSGVGPMNIYLQKTDLDGHVLWVRKYGLSTTNLGVITVPDGYVLSGMRAFGSQHFAFKVNKNGAFLWGKNLTFGPTAGPNLNTIGPNLAVSIADSLYFTGIATTGVPGVADVFLWKMLADGTMEDSCGYIENLQLDGVEVPNVTTVIDLEQLITPAAETTVNPPWTSNTLDGKIICPDCSIPDPCPERNDFVVHLDGISCALGKVNLNFTICELAGDSVPPLSITFYNGNPVTGPADKLGIFNFNSTATDSCVSATLFDVGSVFSAAAAQNGFEIFAFANDNGSVNTPFLPTDFPLTNLAECNYANNLDSIIVLLPPVPTLALGPDRVICAGEVAQLNAGGGFIKYRWSNGDTLQISNITSSNQYRVTVTDICGYQQTDTVNVQVNSLTNVTANGSFCPGSSVTLFGQTFSTAGIFQTTLEGQNGACDTVATVFITQLPYVERIESVFFCPGETVTINGVVYEDSGLARDTLSALTGCDTVVTYFLQQLPLPFRFDTVYICPGGSVEVGGIIYTQPGLVFDTIPNLGPIGCDTLIRVQIELLPQVVINETISFCPGTSVNIGGQNYTQPGTVDLTLPSTTGGCDTLLHYTLEWLPAPMLSETVQFCQGSSVVLGGQTYTQPGTVLITLPGMSGGCDTVITYTLEWLPAPARSESVAFCPGASVVLGGQTYTQPGVVVITEPGTGGGCDTVVTYTLSLLPQPSRAQSVTFCPGTSVQIGGNTYTQPGTVTATIASTTGGCDTLVTYTLSLLPYNSASKTLSFCPGTTVNIGGNLYTQPGTVLDTVASATNACDTIVTYTLQFSPLPTRAQTLEFCQGGSITLGGQTYTQPGTVTLTLPGTGNACDTVVTYTLQFLTPPPSSLSLNCPANLNVATVPGTGPTVVNYSLPTAMSNCVCPGTSSSLTSGLASGSLFPVGATQVCYAAQDNCGSNATCCFTVTVREEAACDTKVNGCLKYEILAITSDAQQRYTYRIRVTNNCTNKLIYTAIQLPNGVTAVSPANNSIYNSPDGRKYDVRNPNFSPFYSIRFKSKADSIANGQSEVFDYTLPAQSHPTYIHITSRLAPQLYYEAHLNTFNCPIGVTPSQNRSDEETVEMLRDARQELLLFPNPTSGELFADLSHWQGEQVAVQVSDSRGQRIQSSSLSAESEAQRIVLPGNLPAGLYFLEILTENGERKVARFVVAR